MGKHLIVFLSGGFLSLRHILRTIKESGDISLVPAKYVILLTDIFAHFLQNLFCHFVHNWGFAIFSEKPRFCSNSQTWEEASADSFGTKPRDLSFAGEMDILR